MFTCLDKPYINFDQYIDINSFLLIKPRVSAFIARHGYMAKPTKFFQGNLPNRAKGINDALEHFNQNPNDFTYPDMVKNLINSDQFGSYIIFEQDLAHSVLSLNLRYSQDYWSKHLANQCHRTKQDYEFDFFYSWLDQQSIFKEYGRVNLFINHPGGRTCVHRDYPDMNTGNNDQFIWINCNPARKKFFLCNIDETEKTYLPGYCNWFNTSNWHGSDPVEQSTYTIRIDGVFTDTFLNKINQPN